MGSALKVLALTPSLLVAALTVPLLSQPLLAQEEATAPPEEVVITGTRIRNPNVIAASPVTTFGEEEIALKQSPNIERIFRDLPITIPGDGENVNNGSAGQATLDLRGLGPERMLILMDGKRLAPYDINGIVTTDVIPVNMLERVDVVTGGASAVYGSDAMSGAVNFVTRKDFEGVEFDLGYSDTDSGKSFAGGGEDTHYINVLLGADFDGGRGHAMLGGGRTKRGSILLGQRTFGLFGVSSRTGSGLGSQPMEPEPACSGNTPFTTAHSTGVGSTTAIPGSLNLRSGNSYQFRDDMSLVAGECARFNFNPFNYYQTPQDRWQATSILNYEINDNANAYARATFSSNTSAFQIAPSGTFGASFTIPVMNPFFTDATRATILSDLNTFAAASADPATDPFGFTAAGILDLDNNDVFDQNDAFLSTARRRTLELGPRTGIFDTDYFQYVVGVDGELPDMFEGWNYDVSYQYGQSDFVETRDGFTNLTNLQTGINTVDATQCITPSGTVTPAPCTPINVFGPFGSITDAQRDDGYFIAIASDLRKATQEIYHASIDGTIDSWSLPSAGDGLSLAFGVEFTELNASSSPDECLKLAPASCQGGAGGNRLPVAGAYSSDEFFAEAILPLVQGQRFAENVSLEAGIRTADYDVQGSTDSWKAGLSWEMTPGFRIRLMEQKAVRVPNVGELFRPITTGLDNATLDPCSIGNPTPPTPGTALYDRCVATGQTPGQVGMTPDIISGQVNVFSGTLPTALPRPEEARTSTYGFIWQPEIEFLGPTTISVDYYNIDIEDYIDTPSGQEAMDLCYVLGDPVACSGIVRIGGALTISGTGVPAFFTNFTKFEAEGIDFSLRTAYDLGNYGQLTGSVVAHHYLTNEFQTTANSPVIDCNGFYGTSCDPVPEVRGITRINWSRNDFDASMLWRHIGSMWAQAEEINGLFREFRKSKSQDYFDLSFGYSYKDMGRVSLLVTNVFDEDPPILGNETGSTSFNSGNTFPSLYDTMGRVYSVNLKLTF